MADAGLGAPAIIGMIGGIVGLIGGLASFYDRFYKNRPVASLTTQGEGEDRLVCLRIKNTTEYDIAILGARAKPPIYIVSDGADTGTLLDTLDGKRSPQFMLRPGESKELNLTAQPRGPEDLEDQRVNFWISWRRGNATWLRQYPVPVCTTTATIRMYLSPSARLALTP
jgi:hypothetical protein